MIDTFNRLVGKVRYFFVVVVLALVIMAVGSFAAALYTFAGLLSGPEPLDSLAHITLISGGIRAGFLYFLAVAFAGLFLGDVPAPQWMTVRNLHQLRTKVLTFVSIILPLAFMGRFAHSGQTSLELLYAGGAVFLVLAGIFLLARFGAHSGDENQAREGNRVPDTREKKPHKQGKHRREGQRDHERGGEGGRHRDADWLEKQKKNLKFEKESIKGAPESDKPPAGGRSNVTVRPGPRRPKRR